MFKKILSIVLLCCTIPAMANAWTLSSRVSTVGGSMTVNGVAMDASAGTVVKSFTANVPVVITAASGYAVSSVVVNNVAITPAPLTTTILAATKPSQTLTVGFAKQMVGVSATIADGGTFAPYVAQSLQAGSSTTYTFTPATGNKVINVTGLAGLVFKDAVTNATVTLPGAVNQIIKTTFTVPTTAVTLVPSFVSLVATAGSNQTVLVGNSATLAGTSIPAATSYAWTQVSGPAVVIPAAGVAGANQTVAFPVAGDYVLQLTATTGTVVSTDSLKVTVATSASVAAKDQCITCHTSAGVGVGVYQNWSTSAHAAKLVMCYTCHVGANTGGHPGTAPTTCVGCHATGTATIASPLLSGSHLGVTDANRCASCHTTGGDFHTVRVTNLAIPAQADCILCHANRYSSFAGNGTTKPASAHFSANGLNTDNSCAFCHGFDGVTATTEHGKAPSCDKCHAAGVNAAFLDTSAGAAGAVCATCHGGGGHPHGILTTTLANVRTSCIDCHAVNQNHLGNFVNDNSGVRAITTEFTKRSHHVTGRDVKDSDCAACHLEGMVTGTKVVVNPAYHMHDNKTYLRNGNTGLVGNQSEATAGAGAGYPWNPMAVTPNYTAMDQFCFSCHNQAGAPQAAAALANAAGYTGTALNPFGDSVSNSYDQVSRVNVVGVYEQFDTGNSSHHAVRGQRYTVSHLADVPVDANGNNVFTNISTANYNFTLPTAAGPAVAAPIKNGVNNVTSAAMTLKSITGTMFELNRFTATYTTVAGATLADNITLHCADCHTVGQFRQSDVNNVAGSFNKIVIGAHGSGNEYMLRNANGDDTLAKNALVCYICHAQAIYDVAGKHNGVNSGDDCNTDGANTSGTDMPLRLLDNTGAATAARFTTFSTAVMAGTLGGQAGGNIFGIKCSNCHNASDGKTLGGIHGNNTYVSYSGGKTTTASPLTAVTRRPYRFMPGLGNFRYNGGDSPSQWTVQTVSSANKQSCYTLNGSKTSTSLTKAQKAGTNVNAAATTDDNGILGSWGACTDHAGQSMYGGQHDPKRQVLRPLTY